MPPTPRPGMANRVWFPDDGEDQDQVSASVGDAMDLDRDVRRDGRPLSDSEFLIGASFSDLGSTISDPRMSGDIASYQPPKSGFLYYLPTAWVPYAELVRINEPAGTFYFYYPFLFGNLLAACLLKTTISPRTLLTSNIILFAASFMARTAACAWSDIMQADYDHQVFRCRQRPIVRGAITPFKGYICVVFLFTMWLGIIATLPGIYYRQVASYVVFNMLYPLSKRYTYYAPLCMGFTLATGVIVGSSVLGVDIIALRAAGGLDHAVVDNAIAAVLCLWLASVMWTVIVEVVQDFQGLKDDLQAGVMSLAVAHHHHAKPMLWSAAIIQVGYLFMTGVLMGAGPIYFAGACGGTAISLTWMLLSVDLESPKSCMWWFHRGHWFVGGNVAGGLAAEYVSRRYGFLG